MTQAAPPSEYTEAEVLWASTDRRLLRVEADKHQFLVEELDWPDEQAARAAHQSDEEWKQWLTYCHHPALLQPLECRRQGFKTLIFYPGREALIAWPTYIAEAFQEYMADEELTLELAFRLTLIWGGMVGKGLRPVAFEKPRPDMVLLTGDGEVMVLPPRFCSQSEPGHTVLLQGMAEILFAALTRHEAASRPLDLPRCRDVNREISLSTQKLVKRCLAGEEEHFETLGALTRALTQQHIKLDPEHPYRDSGPLVNFRALVADREFQPEIGKALDAQAELKRVESVAKESWRPRLWHNPRILWLLLVFAYAIMMLPFYFDRDGSGLKLLAMGLATGIYWVSALAVYHGYRRRNSK